MTFEELVADAARNAHDRLLTDGGKGLKGAMHVWMATAIRWSEEQQKKKKKK